MEIIWNDRVKIELLDRVKVERDTLYIIKKLQS